MSVFKNGLCCAAALFASAPGSATLAGDTPSPFTEEAIARGINYTIALGEFQMGSGLAMLDLNGNGHQDIIVIGASDGRVGLYENDGTGHFIDRTYDGFTPRIAKHTNYSGVSAADYDGDGDLDLYFSRYGAPNLLYRNDGDWQFTDVTVESGLGDPGHSLSTCWADCNGDGLLDVYVTNRTGTLNNFTENAFYENNGDGTFTEKSALLGIQRPGDPTLVVAFFDFDSDGDADLYIGNDKAHSSGFNNYLYRNDDYSFVDITSQANANAPVDCMGIAIGDIDRDGFFDLYLTNLPLGHVLLTSNGDGTFTDRSAEAGVQGFELGWGTLFFDYTNNTWEDIFVCHTINGPNMLFRNDGVFPLTEVGQAMGVGSTANSYVVASADIDGDGDLDLLVSRQQGRVMLYINNEGSKRNWAKFDVVGQGMNTFGVGAQIRVETAEDGRQIREVRAGHHFKTMDPMTQHFGLGEAETMTSITVMWPNTKDTRVLHNYPANHTWTLYPPERIGDYNLDGVVDSSDIQAIYDRYLANTSEPIVPGIEMLDANGDGVFDYDDVLLIGLPCPADLAPPYGILDLADLSAFLAGFTAQDPIADLNGDGLFDLNDIGLFISSFLAGCP